jgi:lycopene cyclase domain-containing protein
VKRHHILKWVIPLGAILLVIVHGFIDDVQADSFVMKVNHVFQIPIFETHYTYIYMHLFALLPVLSLSFDKKVAFYKKWRSLFPALLIVAIIFWIWDIWKTAIGVWGFNPNYYTFKIGNLPIEEWLFFFTFPWASVFIYECLNAYFPKNTLFNKIEYPLSIGLLFLFFGVGILKWGHSYTFTTFILAASLLLAHLLYGDEKLRAAFYRAFLIGLIPFIIVNGILTGAATIEPVVFYNPNEYLGLRCITIPLDDFVYNFVLLLSVLWIYKGFAIKEVSKNR